MKTNLSSDGYLIFSMQLVPPPYITKKMQEKGLKPNQAIPTDLLIEYLDLNRDKSSLSYVNGLRLEVKSAQQKCAGFFKQNPIEFVQTN